MPLVVNHHFNIVNPSRTTVNNYTTLLGNSDLILIDSPSAISKTNSRFTAKNSIIAPIVYAVAIAYFYYILTKPIDTRVEKVTFNAPIGVQIMYQLVPKIYGEVPIGPINPVTSYPPMILYLSPYTASTSERCPLIHQFWSNQVLLPFI